jgi:hypothetical protein
MRKEAELVEEVRQINVLADSGAEADLVIKRIPRCLQACLAFSPCHGVTYRAANLVGWCRLAASKPMLKAPFVSTLNTMIS